MQQLPQALGSLGVEGGVDGAGAGGALAERPLEAPFVEGVDGVAHGLGVAAQGAGDPGGALAPCAGEQDLAAAEDEGVGRAQAFLQGLALVFLKRTHEDGFSHGAQVSTSPTTSSEEALGAIIYPLRWYSPSWVAMPAAYAAGLLGRNGRATKLRGKHSRSWQRAQAADTAGR